MLLPPHGSPVYRALIIIGFLFFAIIAIQMTAYIVVLLVVSIVLTMLAYPAMIMLRKQGLPDIVAVSLLTGAVLLAILLMVVLTLYSFDVLVQDIPIYQEELSERLGELSSFLDGHGIDITRIAGSSINLNQIVQVAASSLVSLGDLLLYIFFIAVTTFFMLLEAPHLAQRVERLFGEHSQKTAQISRMSQYMIEFIIVRTETNFVHGFLFGGALFVMGVHSALLWGILTFILSYIPYIGLIIAAIPAIFFAWLQFGLWGAVAVIGIVCALNLVVENPVFSYFASRKFEIPALVVILSVIIWGWLLGIAGMVFAVPISLMVLILIQMSGDLRWINTVLGVDHLFEPVSGEEER
ncbi:MAG: AI-2E family transporter [Methanomicrobiales archaeon]